MVLAIEKRLMINIWLIIAVSISLKSLKNKGSQPRKIHENASQRSLFIVATHQAAFRLNCFADGAGVLMAAILAALGWAQIERTQIIKE